MQMKQLSKLLDEDPAVMELTLFLHALYSLFGDSPLFWGHI
jgi:hypothetical protein